MNCMQIQALLVQRIKIWSTRFHSSGVLPLHPSGWTNRSIFSDVSRSSMTKRSLQKSFNGRKKDQSAVYGTNNVWAVAAVCNNNRKRWLLNLRSQRAMKTTLILLASRLWMWRLNHAEPSAGDALLPRGPFSLSAGQRWYYSSTILPIRIVTSFVLDRPPWMPIWGQAFASTVAAATLGFLLSDQALS